MIAVLGRQLAKTTDAELWQRLQSAGLVTGEVPAASAPESPWYVRVMLGIAGWIAAIFLLAFVGAALAWVLDSKIAAVIIGVITMGIAWLMLRRWSGNEFSTQFALAISFAGQVLFAFGVFNASDRLDTEVAAWLFLAIVQVVLAILMPNAIHRFCSAYIAAAAFYMVLRAVELPWLGPALLLALAARGWLNEFRMPGRGAMIRPIAYGLVLVTVSISLGERWYTSMTYQSTEPTMFQLYAPWLGALLLGAVLLWVVVALLRRGGLAITGRFGAICLIGALALTLVSLKAPGVTIGVCILLLGYAHRNLVLTGIGVISLLAYIFAYYYQMDVTLLAKAQSLAMLGVVLLVLRWLLFRFVAPREPSPSPESGHA